MVGVRAAEAAAEDLRREPRRRAVEAVLPAMPVVNRELLQDTMSRWAGIGRDDRGLAEAQRTLERSSVVRPLRTRQLVEDAALLLTARALLTAARIRTESRGCHRRTDFPATDDVAWRRSTSLRLDVSGQLIQSGTGIARTAA